ncbi:phage tail protein [Thermomonas sp.]|uniref:phage tail protein n=1 Tax=Thermomonas sp. TaxID=1971895 RepID=UPI003D147B66
MGGKSKKATVGYRYYMSLHMAICYGPVDAMLEIRAGDRTAWKGAVTGSTTIGIDARDLFGGDEREGGIVGLLDVMMGEPTQAPNTYLTNKIGAGRPAYRGLFTTCFHGGDGAGVPIGGFGSLLMQHFGLVINKGGGLITSNNPYIKPWAYQVRRITKGWWGGNCWYESKSQILLNGSFTPGELYYDTGDTYSSIIDGFAQATTAPFSPATLPSKITIQLYEANAAGFISRIQILKNPEATVLYDSGWFGDSSKSSLLHSALSAAGRLDLDGPIRSGYSFSENLNITAGPYTLGHRTMIVRQPALTQMSVRAKLFKSDVDTRIYAMNPAHIVYECLTNPEWGMGYDAGIIDDASFRAAADTFYNEGLGLCIQWVKQDSIESFIQLVLDHAGANLVEDRRTLLWKLIPLRGDYDIETLPVFSDAPEPGQGRIIDLERFERSSLPDATNELSVTYTDYKTGKDGSITVQNLAAVQGAGRVISQSRNYPGIPTPELALRTALRDLRALTSGLAKVQMTVDRSGYDLLPGSVFRWSWSPDGIESMVLRVVNIDYGSLTDGRVRLECVEDVFGLPATTYGKVEPVGWVEPDISAQPSPAVLAFEVPYRELVQTIGRSEAQSLPQETGYVGAVAARAAGVNLSYQLYTRTGTADYADSGSGEWTPTGTLQAAIGPTATSIILTAASDLEQVGLGETAMLGSDETAEIVRVDGISDSTITIARGCLDTVPRAWPAGTRFWGYDQYTASATTEYTDGETVDVKVLTRTASDLLDEMLAPGDSVVMGSRAARPYPPGKLRITDTVASNVAYPTECVGALTVSWAHRDRLLQDDQVIDASEASIGPEAGTTYTVRFYLDGVLDSTQTGISGTSSTPYTLTGNGQGRVEVEAVRDGLTSWQAAFAQFQYYVTIYNTRIVDGGDIRETDGGDTRVTE